MLGCTPWLMEPYLQILQLCLLFPLPPQEFEHFRLLQGFLVWSKSNCSNKPSQNAFNESAGHVETQCVSPADVQTQCRAPAHSSAWVCLCLLEVTDSQYMPHTSAWRSFTLCPSFWVHGCKQPPSPIINWFSRISVATVKISASPLVRNQDWP